jgi:hypothetical protein
MIQHGRYAVKSADNKTFLKSVMQPAAQTLSCLLTAQESRGTVSYWWNYNICSDNSEQN